MKNVYLNPKVKIAKLDAAQLLAASNSDYMLPMSNNYPGGDDEGFDAAFSDAKSATVFFGDDSSWGE